MHVPSALLQADGDASTGVQNARDFFLGKTGPFAETAYRVISQRC